jgi:2-methylcitrate dehydratase PrpD
MALAADLADFSVATGPGAIPPRLRRDAALHLLDACGCGLAAVGLGAGAAATELAVAQGGSAEASVLGVATKLPAPLAAFANGTRFHALDFDDTHEAGICHSSAVLAAAALATGEAAGRSGEEIVDAFLLGSEVALRIAAALADRIYALGFHPTSVCGSFGATAAAGRLLGLDAATTANALGVVGSFAAGLLEYLADGSETKPLHAGWAAQAGIQAARLAAAGASGPASVIEGRFGLAASHGAGGADLEPIAAGLGAPWELEQLAYKPYPACHFAHSSTWAARELADEHGIDAAEIAEVLVWVPPEGAPLVIDPIESKRVPRTPYDAKFSLPFMVAHVLVHGELGLTAFGEEEIGEEAVLALAARVSQAPAPERLPSRFCGGTEIVTVAGERFAKAVDYAPGSPANPLGEEWLLAKLGANAGLALDPEAAAELLRRLRELGSGGSVEAAMELARSAAAVDAGDQPVEA